MWPTRSPECSHPVVVRHTYLWILHTWTDTYDASVREKSEWDVRDGIHACIPIKMQYKQEHTQRHKPPPALDNSPAVLLFISK